MEQLCSRIDFSMQIYATSEEEELIRKNFVQILTVFAS